MNCVCFQSDDTDATTANEDDVLHQQPNNTRAGSLGPGAKTGLSSKARYGTAELKASQHVAVAVVTDRVSLCVVWGQKKGKAV